MAHEFLLGLSAAVTPYNLLMGFLGAVIGTIVGVIPGLGPAPVMALALPFTFGMEPVSGIIFLSGVYHGSKYGSVIPSILINSPGEASAVVTTFDGYPMTQQGRAGQALGLAAIASFVGGTISTIGVMVLAPLAEILATHFGPPEYAALVTAAIILIAGLGYGSMLKAVLSATFGFLFGCVGIDPTLGEDRFTFGFANLSDGVSFVVAAMGLFAMSEILINVRAKHDVRMTAVRFRDLWPRVSEVLPYTMSYLRGTAIGFFVGMLPGAGATVSSFVSYGIERLSSRTPERFGHGAPEGLVASESAINSASGSAMLPLLTLGIPSSAATAILLGAMILYGLHPGPLLFQEQPHLVWTVIASLYVANVILLVLNWPMIPVFASIVRIPYKYLYPAVIALLAVGSLILRDNPADLWMMIAFGVVGYFMRLYAFPLAPMLLALVLGPLLEQSLSQSLTASHGSPMIFIQHPICVVLLLAAILPYLVVVLLRRRSPKPADASI